MKATRLYMLFFCTLALIIHFLIDIFALSSIAQIEIRVKPHQDSQLSVYLADGISGSTYKEENSLKSELIKKNVKTDIVLNFKNQIARKIRIDPFDGSGSAEIYSIKIASFFGDTKDFSPRDIVLNFSNNSSSSFTLTGSSLLVHSTGADPEIELISELRFYNPFFSFILPVFLSLLCTVFFKTISLKKIYAIVDIENKKPSSSGNINALDGVRGFAALLVLADHTGYIYFKGFGAIGVWLFFSLSGFLLSGPLVKNPGLVMSSNYVQTFIMRRIFRILPMYYTVLVVTYLLPGNVELFFRHIVFIQGDGIYWSVPQEMLFYMILPILFFGNYYLFHGKPKAMIFTSLFLVIIGNHCLELKYLYIYGNHMRLPLWFGIFLSGVCLSCIYHSKHGDFLRTVPHWLYHLTGLLLLTIILLSSKGVAELLFSKSISYPWLYPGLYGYIATLLLLVTIVNKQTIVSRIMSFYPLRAVGIVGFSFYLLHPNVLNMIRKISLTLTGQPLQGMVLFFVAIIFTYILSVASYSMIERPFLKL